MFNQLTKRKSQAKCTKNTEVDGHVQKEFVCPRKESFFCPYSPSHLGTASSRDVTDRVKLKKLAEVVIHPHDVLMSK